MEISNRMETDVLPVICGQGFRNAMGIYRWIFNTALSTAE
jgi:hypothetical protein